MNLTRKTLTTLGGVLLVALLIAALAPKATRGVVASLVQVANTSANPVPNRDIDNGPRQGVTLFAQTSGNINFVPLLDLGDPANPTPYSVPAGKRLLVQFISGRFQTPAGAHISDATMSGAVRPHPGARLRANHGRRGSRSSADYRGRFQHLSGVAAHVDFRGCRRHSGSKCFADQRKLRHQWQLRRSRLPGGLHGFVPVNRGDQSR